MRPAKARPTRCRFRRPNVRVITDYMGGGFGSKLGGDVQVVIAAKLAKAAGAPVKLMLNRKDEHLITGNRPSAYAKVRAGVDAQGKLDRRSTPRRGVPAAPGRAPASRFRIRSTCFRARRQRHTDVYINAGPQRAMRAPGHPQACFITEVVMDELADRLRMDPLELRMRNLPPVDGRTPQWAKYFPIGAEKIGWCKRHPTGDPGIGPDQARTRMRSQPLGRSGGTTGDARALRDSRLTAASSCASAPRTSAPERERSSQS